MRISYTGMPPSPSPAVKASLPAPPAVPTQALDDFWVTPAMGLRMTFSFAQSVIGLTEKTEAKRRAADRAAAERAAMPAISVAPAKQAQPPAQNPPLPAPPVPPPARFLRY